MKTYSRYFLLLVAIAHFVAPALPALGIGVSQGERATENGIPPELPFGFFFSIWGIIFLGFLIIAIWHFRSPNHASNRIAIPLAMVGLGNVLWMLSAQGLGLVWLDFILLLPILFFAWEAAYRLDRTLAYDGTLRSILHGLVVGLLAGWLSVAVSISVPDLVRWILGRGVTDHPWQSLWMALVPAVIFATVFASYVSRNGWYFVALAWGLTGIIFNNWIRLGTHGLAIATTIVGAYVLLRRIRFGASGSYAEKP